MGEEKNILIKVHESYREVVAVCDKELFGRKFVEGRKQLDLTGEFFNGLEFSEEGAEGEIIRLVREDATFNIVGENSVEIAKKIGIVLSEGVGEIDGIPFALVLL